MANEDFSSSDLRDESFRGRDLRGARFRGADVRGADFTGADLREADFTSAKAGTSAAWKFLTVGMALIASVALGVATARAGDLFAGLMGPGDHYDLARIVVLLELGAFLVATLVFGFRAALKWVAVIVPLAVIAGTVNVALGLGTGHAALVVVLLALASAAIVVAGTCARAVAGGSGLLLFFVVAIGGGLAAKLAGGGLAAVAVIITSAIVGRRALAGDARYPGVGRLALSVACRGGTRFVGANLTGTTFRDAKVRGSDFRGAVLDRARLDDASGVDVCRFDDPLREAEGNPRPAFSR